MLVYSLGRVWTGPVALQWVRRSAAQVLGRTTVWDSFHMLGQVVF
jgi:hypothetical protein